MTDNQQMREALREAIESAQDEKGCFKIEDVCNNFFAISQPAASAEVVTYNYWRDVFKNADCFERWANCDGFWENQPYGTRFYFGECASDYINRGILQAAVKQLNQLKTPTLPAQPGTMETAQLQNNTNSEAILQARVKELEAALREAKRALSMLGSEIPKLKADRGKDDRVATPANYAAELCERANRLIDAALQKDDGGK